MKKLLLLIILIISLRGISQGYPLTQNIGSSSTKVQVPANGAMNALFINRPFNDTTSANLTNIKFYNGAQIFTLSDSTFWLRVGDTWVKTKGNGSGSTSDTTKTLPVRPIRITYAGQYNQSVLPIKDKNGNTHLIAMSGVNHSGYQKIIDISSSDNFKVWTRNVIISDADTAFYNPAGGLGSDGNMYLFVALYTKTNDSTWATFQKCRGYRSTDNGVTWSVTQETMPMNGNSFIEPYGKMIILPSGKMLQTFYGGNAHLATLYSSTNGITWSVYSNIYSPGSLNLSETAAEIISNTGSDGNTVIVAASRSDDGVNAANFFKSIDGGVTWHDCGPIYKISSYGLKGITPFLQKIGSEVHLLWVSRIAGKSQVYSFVYDNSILSNSVAYSTLTQDAYTRTQSMYESACDFKDESGDNFSILGSFGNPVPFLLNNEYFFAVTDQNPYQAKPYQSTDSTTVDIILQQYTNPVLKLKAYNNAGQTMVNNTVTQLILNNAVIDNYGVLNADSNYVIIPHDGYYNILGQWSTGNTSGGTKTVTIYANSPGDPASTSKRIIVATSNQTAGQASVLTTVATTNPYYFTYGTVLRAYFDLENGTGNQTLDGMLGSTGIFNGLSITEVVEPGGFGTNANLVDADTSFNSIGFLKSVTKTSNIVSLVNDQTSPGNSVYYGTDAGGIKGFYTLPTASTYTASNLSGTGVGVYKTTVANDFQFKRLVAGANTTITDNTDSITISTSTASAWTTSGNTVSSYGKYLGTNDNFRLRFFTNNVERVSLDSVASKLYFINDGSVAAGNYWNHSGTIEASISTRAFSQVLDITSTSAGIAFNSGGATKASINSTGLGVKADATNAFLEIGAGTVGTAPLNINPSANLLTAGLHNGNIENDSTHLYVTLQSARWQLDRQVAAANITSGTYIPTLTNTTNISASTAYRLQYMRVDSVITVSGKVDIDPTSTGATELRISLPISMAQFANDYEAGGTANSAAVATEEAAISAVSGAATVAIKFIAVDLSNKSYFFTFSYVYKGAP